MRSCCCFGGPTEIDNLRSICGSCNKSMGTMNMENFKKTINNLDLFLQKNKNNFTSNINTRYVQICKTTCRKNIYVY